MIHWIVQLLRHQYKASKRSNKCNYQNISMTTKWEFILSFPSPQREKKTLYTSTTHPLSSFHFHLNTKFLIQNKYLLGILNL